MRIDSRECAYDYSHLEYICFIIRASHVCQYVGKKVGVWQHNASTVPFDEGGSLQGNLMDLRIAIFISTQMRYIFC